VETLTRKVIALGVESNIDNAKVKLKDIPYNPQRLMLVGEQL